MTHAENIAALVDGYVAGQVAPVLDALESSRSELRRVDALLEQQRQVSASLASERDALASRVAELEAQVAPAPRFPAYVHLPTSATATWPAVADRPWATGLFVYFPGQWRRQPHASWGPEWEQAVALHPDGMDTLVSPKAVDDAALRDLLDRLPQAWRDRMVFCYYQEPEDNHTTPEARAGFRAQVKRAAAIVRPYGVRNGVELQEWALDPGNTSAWAGAANVAALFDPADADVVSFSCYEYVRLRDRSQQQVDRMAGFVATYAPASAWEASACGISVPDGTPAGDAKRVLRAELVGKLIDRLRAAGASGFGWWDFRTFGDPAKFGDSDTLTDPLLRDVLVDRLT